MELPDVDTACKVAHALLTRLVQQDMPDGRPRVWECRTWDEAGARFTAASWSIVEPVSEGRLSPTMAGFPVYRCRGHGDH